MSNDRAMVLWKRHSPGYLILLCFLLGGCASTAASALEEYPEPPVRMLFGTDRNRTDATDPGKVFGFERGDVAYGVCTVSLPFDHRIGELERPVFKEDSAEHVVLIDVCVYDRQAFFTEMQGCVNRSVDKQLLLFLHGYNMTFEKAAHNMAQIVADLGFEGCPVFYSWPSRGKVSGYPADETSVRWSKNNLKKFLEDIAVKSGSKSIYLLAHSMGNRILTDAFLELIEERQDLKRHFKALLLVAPDIDTGIFKRDIAERLGRSGSFVTIYASSEDKALKASRRIHGFPRVGEVEGIPLIVPEIETIDATGVDTSFLGHSYFNRSRSVLSDIYYIINEDLQADERFSLEAVDTTDGFYWRFKE
ncbi:MULTISPECIES: alpha/beta hydrolase [unclassified Prosthecochloris]|uniref:alpha/beta hydrolase n=1 Tax=unclassified Prosthecochloris TaxID=2632826 RepID=UPI00223DA407|nr:MULTISPECIES: alpha/beta hydrolase [unclassified Prosthecochloris]UZJ37140.1 alpha/beta hydrolase [Prosthecochloris sp. SCSIO W1103]UZJ38954.1 alpha/beta hydrolase [Prosthecochloris sp. SCSIO W1102]